MDNKQIKEATEAVYAVADALRKLGFADAVTPYGAIEAHNMMLEQCAEKIADGLNSVASALESIAEAIREGKG